MMIPNQTPIYDAMRRVPPVRHGGKYGTPMQPQTPNYGAIQPQMPIQSGVGVPGYSNADPNIHPALMGAMSRMGPYA